MEPAPRPIPDMRRVLRLFQQRGAPSFIIREIAARMGERLDLLRIEPPLVIDVGSGDGPDLEALRRRYPKASVLGIDLAPRRKSPPRSLVNRFRQMLGDAAAASVAQADTTQLPLPAGVVDLIWSNCVLHWIADAEAAIVEWARVLKPEAALLFSCLGPDSLKQVREAFLAVDQLPHTIAFTDLHDYGDMLAAAGFAQPVMDMERLTLTYRHADAFWADVRALGGNPLQQRGHGLLGRHARARLDAALEAQRNAQGELELSIEIIYGHAWKGALRTRSDGLSVVALPKPTRPR